MSRFSRVAGNARPLARSLRGLGVSLLCFIPCVASYAADPGIAELQRAIEELRAQNRALTQRLESLEGQQAGQPQEKAPEKATAAQVDDKPGEPLKLKREADLEQRVKDLEMAKAAQEDATRSIIRDGLTSLGSKINENVSLSGTLDVTAERKTDFTGVRKSSVTAGASLEFDIQTTDWALGHIKLEYVDGASVPFLTSAGGQASVDRINLDMAYIALGNLQKFPVALTAGKVALPFGISTGHPVADVLSVASPLTVETFEMRQNAFSLNFGFPTPAQGPTLPPVISPPVNPVALYPLLSAAGQALGYKPPEARPPPLTPTPFVPEPPPFTGGAYMFDARFPTQGGMSRHYGGTLGYRAGGTCGKRYEDLAGSFVCPWTVNADLAFISSVFSSRFLELEYERYLAQIGNVPGISASVKSSFGPFLFVGEWNGATKVARFVNELARPVSMRPEAWQASLGYQLGWNPWVKEIGAQGTYLAVGYSESHGLAGTTILDANGVPTRVGFVPSRRLLLTAGEWMLSGVRFVIEYSRNTDYSVQDGGTGRVAPGISATLTYQF